MKREYSFDDAQKGVTGTPVAVNPDDPCTQFLLKELGFIGLSSPAPDPRVVDMFDGKTDAVREGQ